MNDREAVAGRLRKRMVTKMVSTGVIGSDAIEEALRTVPRHRFVSDIPLREAYADRPKLTMSRDGQTLSTISQPTMIAIMLREARLEAGQTVFELGTGTGYNAALMAHLVGPDGAVYTVDVEQDLVDRARTIHEELGIDTITAAVGDGRAGWPAHAPFHRIMATAAAEEVPAAWIEQLRDGGRLVVPLSGGDCVTYLKDSGRLDEVGRTPARFLSVRDR